MENIYAYEIALLSVRLYPPVVAGQRFEHVPVATSTQ
jgi:hypothetical protein